MKREIVLTVVLCFQVFAIFCLGVGMIYVCSSTSIALADAHSKSYAEIESLRRRVDLCVEHVNTIQGRIDLFQEQVDRLTEKR